MTITGFLLILSGTYKHLLTHTYNEFAKAETKEEEEEKSQMNKRPHAASA